MLEVGPGTGAITRALLERGVPASQLFLIERDPDLARFLKRTYPGIAVRCGDALDCAHLLEESNFPAAHTVVSSLPLRNLDPPVRARLLKAMLKTLSPDGQLLQYTYGRHCPLTLRPTDLHAERLGCIWRNLPPASVWRFSYRRTVAE